MCVPMGIWIAATVVYAAHCAYNVFRYSGYRTFGEAGKIMGRSFISRWYESGHAIFALLIAGLATAFLYLFIRSRHD